MDYHDPSTGSARVRTAVLLAAGLGSRLAPFTDAVPKCMVPVAGKPVLERIWKGNLRRLKAKVEQPSVA